MERISTGIDGLDRLLGGGYPKGKSTLIGGDAGTGKTIFSLQFIKRACEKGLKCFYFAVEEKPADLMGQAAAFGWNLEKYEEDGTLRIGRMMEERSRETDAQDKMGYTPRAKNIGLLAEKIPTDVDVVVIDNIGIYSMGMDPWHIREQLDALVYKLAEKGITALIICDEALKRDIESVAVYSVYGALRLLKYENPYTGKRERRIDIVKMRSTSIPIDFQRFDITKNGIMLVQDAPAMDDRKRPII